MTFEPPIGDRTTADYGPDQLQPADPGLGGKPENPGLIGGLLGGGLAALPAIGGAISAFGHGRQTQSAHRSGDFTTRATSFADANPPVGALIVIGVLLTFATLVVEGGFVYAEAALAAPSLTGNPLAIVGESILISLSLFLINFEVAYWAYVYRVVGARAGEKVELTLTPFDWGLYK